MSGINRVLGWIFPATPVGMAIVSLSVGWVTWEVMKLKAQQKAIIDALQSAGEESPPAGETPAPAPQGEPSPSVRPRGGR